MSALIPTAVFSGYIATGTEITIPLAALPGLTSAEANATTGDAREILRIILEKYAAVIESLSSENKPEKMLMNRGGLVGLSATQIRRSYNISFDESVGTTSTTIVAEA